MQLLGILLAANRVHTVNFQAFLASDKFPICLVTVFVFVFFNICICVVRQLYYLDILAVHALLGNNTSNHSSSSHIWALQSRILHYRTFVSIKFTQHRCSMKQHHVICGRAELDKRSSQLIQFHLSLLMVYCLLSCICFWQPDQI